MELKKYVADFADLFEMIDPSEITEKTVFHNLSEWDSLLALAVMNMTSKKYGKEISLEEMRGCVTVEDLFNIIQNK